MLDIFKTHTMLLLVKELNPLHTFLRDRYFPTNESTDLFATDDVLVQYRSGSKNSRLSLLPAKAASPYCVKVITWNATRRPISRPSAP